MSAEQTRDEAWARWQAARDHVAGTPSGSRIVVLLGSDMLALHAAVCACAEAAYDDGLWPAYVLLAQSLAPVTETLQAQGVKVHGPERPPVPPMETA